MENRNRVLDAIRGIAVICMVLGHTIQMGNGNDYINGHFYYENWCFKFIYMFHMPLFAFISGYLLKYSILKRPYFELVFNKIKLLLIPVISWSIIDFFLLLGRVEVEPNFIDICKLYLSTLFSALWFFWASLIVMLIIATINIVVKKSHKKCALILYLVPIIFFFFTPDIFFLKYVKYLYINLLIGYLWGDKFIETQKKRRRVFIYCILSLLLFTILYHVFDSDCYIYTTGINLLNKASIIMQFRNDIIRWLAGIVGSIFVILFVNCIYSMRFNVIWSKIESIGNESLGIYITNIYLSNYILRNISYSFEYSFMRTCILSIVILALCIAIVKLLKHNNVIKFLFLGGK